MGFFDETEALLRDWCDGLLAQQIRDPERPDRHGAFACPACDFLHGRCGDAVLPLLSMAALSGEERYRQAALDVVGWMRNVDAPDGSWTNEVDPGSWKGTTVFAAIALAEALEWHGGLLGEPTRAAWRERLRRAGNFILLNFDTEYGNINYGATATYGLALLGRLLDEPAFTSRARQLARQVLGFLTPGLGLLHGEGRPSDKLTPKGCYAVDLGYNVEESLPALINYALLAFDQEVFDAAMRSMSQHALFLLPDGGWDNSWGTRNYKWSYWGSRTSDGCQAALLQLATRQPLYATAAWRNLRLLRACTHDGLLHGGPHLASHGVPPCVHHTFCHAKTLAASLRLRELPIEFDYQAPLWAEDGGTHSVAFPEIATFRAAVGPWQATITAYDWLYRPGVHHATGGALSLLWHRDLGLVTASSLARYVAVEGHNMQPNPDGEDICLTPRVQLDRDDDWYTNLFSLRAGVWETRRDDGLELMVEAHVVNRDGDSPASGPVTFDLRYRLRDDSVTISAAPLLPCADPWTLVLPIISPSGEPVRWASARRVEFSRPESTLVIEANVPIVRQRTAVERAFNSVGGFEALPLLFEADGVERIEVSLSAR